MRPKTIAIIAKKQNMKPNKHLTIGVLLEKIFINLNEFIDDGDLTDHNYEL